MLFVGPKRGPIHWAPQGQALTSVNARLSAVPLNIESSSLGENAVNVKDDDELLIPLSNTPNEIGSN